MKKNFVKKSLASTLALAMVATAMPAAFTTASAAAAPKLNKTSKTLYINENAIGSSFDFNISNKVSGSKYAWTTSNKAIATVNSKGLTKAATKTGEATISCKITLPTKKTKTLKATVTVKENATKVVIKNAPTTEIGIGTNAYDFDSTMTSASGAKATDYRTWEIDEASNTAGATIDAKNGKVTTTKAGSFKVRVRAYQNKTKLAANDTVDSEWLTVKVVSSVVSVAQTATNKVAVTFDDNMKEAVKAENFAVKNKATNVVSAVKGISFSEDGKVVTVETFASYADGATYVLTYNEKDYEFATTIGEVASIEVKTSTVVENKATAIEYVLKNANGVDITDAKKSTVTIEEVENKDGWYNTTDGKLTIFNKGSVAKVKVTYHTYKYDTAGNEEGSVSVEATITAVEETAATIGAYKNYVITDKASVNWDKVTENKNVICVNETLNLFLKAVDSNNDDVTGLTFESGNENILLVSTTDAHATLTAVKEGSTVVVVKNEKGSVLWTLPVVIKAERKANTISLAKSSTTLVTGTEIAQDTIEVKIKDQHNEDFPVAGNFATPVPVKAYTGAPEVSVSGVNVTVDARTATAGTYQYKVALASDENKVTVLTVVVKAKPASAVSAYKLDLSANTVDTIVDEDTTETKSLAVKVLGYAEGLAVENTDCTITVTGPNNYKETYENNFDFEYVTVSEGKITKLAKGTYTITATKDSKTIAKTAVVVSDSQVAPTVTVNKTSFEGSVDEATVLAAMQANCTVKNAAGKELKVADGVGITGVTYTNNGSQVFVKTVTISEKFGENVFEHTVTVGKTITIK
ncbi:hypothetical protein [Anaerosporobacter faecicola]|uniref:hypothetical protein n=1 Tax=Anaerosporobacter faecicola TaxID=2718714 RepID=UPI0014397732|nr:hypothetical protein [Anaerosporobacter faecicola]